MAILITLAVIFTILCLNEFWWRKQKKANEFSRKFIHIVVGVYSAFWPFYLSFTEIKFLSLACIVVMLISRHLNIFKSIHNINRASWGEICAVLTLGLIAFMTHDKWLYAASIMQMALADGLAAIIGVSYGKSSRYKVLDQTKSVVGTFTFFIVSLVILVVFKQANHLTPGILYLGLTSLVAAAIENFSIQGLDNLLVPVVVLIMLIHH